MKVKNIIFTVHGWAFNEERLWISKRVIQLLYLIMLKLSHNIIAVSNTITTQVERWPFPKKKITVIHNGIQAPEFLSKETARAELCKILDRQHTAETIYIGSIGELHPIKGHIYALQAIEQIKKEKPNLHIIYIIIGAGEIENILHQEIIHRKLTDIVFLTGYIANASNYLKAFEYYLFPSLSEGLPYALVEAGFAELPVIASDVGGIPEVITHTSEGILVESKNVQAIVEAIYTYIERPDQAHAYAKALYEKVTHHYTVETMLKKTIDIYLK